GAYTGTNGPVVDLNLLKANPLCGGTEQLPQMHRLLSDNEAIGGWLIFYTHDVRANPSPHGCTIELLAAAVAAAAQRNTAIMPIASALKYFDLVESATR